MTTLRQIQYDIQRFLLTAEQTAQQHVLGQNTDFINLRLSLYSDAYELRLLDILATDFPGVKALAGDELFEKMALAYIAEHPSAFQNARYFGSHFANYLAEQYQQRPEFAEMAIFEWAIGLAEDAEDKKPLTQADLTEISQQGWPEFKFKLHPSVQFVELSFNIPQIWQMVQKQELLPNLYSANHLWIIWRHELTAFFHSFDSMETAFLLAIKQGKNFTEICETLCEQFTEADCSTRIPEILGSMIANQMLI